MRQRRPKVIGDPVHSLIPFENTDRDRLLLRLIDTNGFQRLRRIKQLGMGDLVFPGATHTRFSHSIGVMHVARRLLDRIAELLAGDGPDEEASIVISAAALLHDVGHGPFSHSFERATGSVHEGWTRHLIRSDETGLRQCLRDFDTALPDLLDAFLATAHSDTPNRTTAPRYQNQIVTSQLDADRLDYLLRDSYATGTHYGQFNLDWLIHHIVVNGRDGALMLDEKALVEAESYVFARHHMYRTVYFHKTLGAAQVMLNALLRRFQELLGECASDEARRGIVPECPPVVIRALGSNEVPLDAYFALDDYAMTEFFKAACNASDPILRDLATGLVYRRLFKATEIAAYETRDPEEIAAFTRASHAVLADVGLDPAYYFTPDETSDTPYLPYEPGRTDDAGRIFIQTRYGPRELSEISPTVARLGVDYRLMRFYYPACVRERVDTLARETFGAE